MFALALKLSFILLCWCSFSWAQTSKNQINLSQYSQASDVTVSRGGAMAEGYLELERFQYLSEFKGDPKLNSNDLVSARLNARANKGLPQLSYELDLGGGNYLGTSKSYFFVNDVYIRKNFENGIYGSMGRMRSDWSQLDHAWDLGLWQPQFLLDPLQPEEQGLTGFFIGYQSRFQELTVFVTPVFIPTMYNDVDVDDQGNLSTGRWRNTYGKEVEVAGQKKPLKTKIDLRSSNDLVKNGAGAVKYRLGDKSKGPWILSSASRKPVNGLIFQRENYLPSDVDEVRVNFTPDVAYHQIYSADIGYSFSAVQWSISYLTETPENKSAVEGKSIQRLAPIRIYSTQLGLDLDPLMKWNVQMELGYMRAAGGEIEDVTEDGTLDDFTLFKDRLLFSNAGMIKLHGRWKRLQVRMKYLYDFVQIGSLFSSEFSYWSAKSLAFRFGIDVLGVEDEAADREGFLNQFRANDRVYGGVTYAF